MEFCRQEYQSGLPFPSPGELPDPGIEPGSPALWADALPPEPQGSPYLAKEGGKEAHLAFIAVSRRGSQSKEKMPV